MAAEQVLWEIGGDRKGGPHWIMVDSQAPVIIAAMTLINLSLLGGVLLAGVPVILHLVMRARPKRIEFPALRLLRTRRTSNARRMRVRHLLLLILRALLIAVAVLALARPSLPAAQYGLLWYEWLLLTGVAAAAAVVYRWRSQKIAATEAAEHVARERRSRLRAFSLLGGLLAVLLIVGLPWGVRLRAELSSPRNPVMANIPVAAVFVFDTSLSMTYRHESRTRLEEAVSVALEHLEALPPQSRVAVATTNPESEAVFQADLAGVRSRIEDLKTHAVPRSLNQVIKDAIESHVTDRDEVQRQITSEDAFAREIYLLTDLSEAAWDDPDESGLRDLLIQYDWLQVYIIDVSVSNPINMSLSQLTLDREATTSGRDVYASVTVSATPAAADAATVEVFTLGAEGEEIPGGGAGGSAQQRVAFEGTPPVVVFPVAGDPETGSQQGFIRLGSPDPMPFDDVRYFTFGVRDVPRVLLVGDEELDAWYLRNILQPVEYDRLGIRRFDCTSVTGSNFDDEVLSDYDVICVTNWRRPPAEAWSDLERFVRGGGALFVTIGGSGGLLDVGDWSTPEAEALLPGIPLIALNFRPDPARLTLVADGHPVLAAFQESADARTELTRALFDRSWTLDPAEDARTLLTYNDRQQRPALVERRVGQGRVMLLTSAVDNRGVDKWNEDFITNDAWGFLMLADQIMAYLTGASEARRNFTVGRPVEIPVPDSERFGRYRLSRPRFRRTEGSLPFNEQSVLLTDINEAGHYRLRAADEGNLFSIEFAANDIDSESNLTLMTDDSLNRLLGEDRYSRVTDPAELDRAVNLGRLGVEVFPVLMGLLVVLLCGEHLMANYFYDEEPEAIAAA